MKVLNEAVWMATIRISNKSFMPFVWYRVALGIVIIALVSADVLSPHAAESAS